MPQIHCYLPDELAQRLQQKARASHLSVSKYLAQLVRRELDNQWPKDFQAVFGAWQGKPLVRPDQGEYESRDEV